MESNKLVMIIDDSPTVCKIIEVSLRRQGIASLYYANGVDALRALKKQPELVPDLVLLDIGLPQMDGYKVAQLLKARPAYHKTIIIMLSARNSVLDRLKGRLAGARVYLTKPFKTLELMDIICELLGLKKLALAAEGITPTS